MEQPENLTLAEGAQTTPNFDFLLDTPPQTALAEHRAWLKSIKHERPQPDHPFRVAVYIRYFNQTRYENYLELHKKAFADSMARCPNWDFVGFYIDEGSTAPRMESAKAWSRLLQDCQDGKVDLIVTQKTGNVSQKPLEVSFCARLLAALPHPVGIYFISEDIFTLASYYQEDLRDPLFLPDPETPAREEHHDVCSRKTQRPLPKGTCAPENPHAN